MIEVDAEAALLEIGQIIARAAMPTPVFELIGQSEVDNARARITESKAGPLGADWDAWADSTRKYRERKGNAGLGLLWDEGDLLDSIHFAVEGPSVAIGSDLDYARYLQEGTEAMPAREFLGWSPDMLPFYEQLFATYIQTGVA